jgi:hypothetical protein
MNKITRRARLPGLVQWAAVAVSIALPILEIAKITLSSPPIGGNGLLALVATTCYLRLHLRQVVYALRGARPPGARWTLTAMAIIILGAVPIIGLGWLSALPSLAVSVLILLRPQECAFQAAATMGDQVAFEKAWLDVVPFGERTYRDLLLEQAPRLRGREPMRVAEGPKQTIRRGRAECQYLFTDLVREAQVAVTLERWDQTRPETAPGAWRKFHWPPTTRWLALPGLRGRNRPVAVVGSERVAGSVQAARGSRTYGRSR